VASFQVVRRALDARTAKAVRALADEVAAADGYPGLDEKRLRQVVAGAADGFLAALAWDQAESDLVAYVQAVRGRQGWDVERVVAPGWREHEEAGGRLPRMLQAVLDGLAVDDGAEVRLWAHGATAADDRLAAGLRMHPVRELQQLRRELPVDEPFSLATRPFVVGQDEPAWLRVNNRAFRVHPDQGEWSLAELQARERAPWFNPEGFLLHEREGQLVGFCWTKVHRPANPEAANALGEIYVIGVDPDWKSHGLGRALVLAGLDHLSRDGLKVAMLYVESTNTKARRLYEDLGFTVHHVDRAYAR
jgi:mycothiol synthase